MKPIELQIAGLNSFRQSTKIDFGALVKDGLFGIFGPTGSGKSTILDAITLALYGRVTRAGSSLKGLINLSEQSCSVGFAFAVGTGDTRKHYLVEKRLVRARKGDGVETKTARLIEYVNGTPVPLADKSHEVHDRVQSIIGINHDDFQRAVVLPQGAFAEFLGLKPSERSAVLERLFGLHDLGHRLNTLLRERADALELRRAELIGKLQELRAYDADALASAEQRHQIAVNAHEQARAESTSAELRRAELRALRDRIEEQEALKAGEGDREERNRRADELAGIIDRAERAASVAPARVAFAAARERYSQREGQYQEMKQAHDSAEAACTALLPRVLAAREAHKLRFEPLGLELAVLDEVRRAKLDLRNRRAQCDSVEHELTTARHAFQESMARHNTYRDTAEATQKELATLNARIAEADMPAAERDRYKRLELGVARLRDAEARASRAQEHLEQLHAACEHARSQATVAEQQRDVAHAALDRARTGLAAARAELEAAEQLRGQLREQFVQVSAELSEAERIHDDVVRAELEAGQLADTASAQRKAAEHAEALHAAATAERDSLRARHHTALGQCEQLRRDNALAELAGHLLDGRPCPLCGASDHPQPFHVSPDTIERLAEADRQAAQLGEQLVVAEERCSERDRLAATAVATAAAAEAAARQASDRAGAVRAQLARHLLKYDVAGVAGLRAMVEAIKDQGLAARARSDVAGVAIAAGEEQHREAEEAHGNAVVAHANAVSALAAANKRLAEARGLAKKEDDEAADLRRALAELAEHANLDELAALIEEAQMKEAQLDGLRAGARVLSERQTIEAQAAEAARADVDRLRDKVTAVTAEHEAMARELRDKLAETTERWEATVPAAERELGTDVDAAIERRQAERSALKDELDRVEDLYKEASQQLRTLHGQLDLLWNDLMRDEVQRDEAGRAFDAALVQYGVENAAQAAQWELGMEALERLRAERAAIAEELAHARRRMAELQEMIGGQHVDDAEVSAATTHAELMVKQADEASREEAVATANLATVREKHVEYRKAMAEDAFSSEGKATVEQLTRYLRGNGFIDYLANERLADICRRASGQLAGLTSGRFEILARPKEGFIIRDNAAGGGERAPSTLSGGETFVVSLSLALALSDTIQVGHAPLEFFFLDEGFGTLDSSLLETVMNTLERLRSEHRAIGVISHVAQLRERISRRLVVTPAANDMGSTVQFELA